MNFLYKKNSLFYAAFSLLLYFNAPLAFGYLNDVPEQELSVAVNRIKASHFLHQATFGPTFDDINSLAARMTEIGEQAALNEWIDLQMAMPFDATQSYEHVARDMISTDGFTPASRPRANNNGLEHRIQEYGNFAGHTLLLTSENQLRHRVAFAYSQFLVISKLGSSIDLLENGQWLGSLHYYDKLTEQAFGNYRDILYDVSLSPAMGVYLSHLRNRKAVPEKGIFPDENFAREIMQLFSLGVYQLNQDGSFALANGERQETYSNDTIRNLARVFTGLSFAPSAGKNSFLRNPRNMFEPMSMYEDYHDVDEKNLLGVALPAGQSGLDDINAAVDILFNHTNVPPFLARLLIQRFTSSNPSPAYIEAVANQFSNDGSGVRGNMGAVVRAILMHPEVRNSLTIASQRKPNGNFKITVSGNNVYGGKLREPMLTLSAMYRTFKVQAAHPDGRFRPFSNTRIRGGQEFLYSPSVFNFYLPDHQPAGLLKENGLVAPEFQIHTPIMIALFSNFIRTSVETREYGFREKGTMDFSAEEILTANIPALLERLNLLLAYGTLNEELAEQLQAILNQTGDQRARLRLALITLLNSPDFMVME